MLLLTSVYYCCLFRYRLSPENFGYTLVYSLDRGNLACFIIIKDSYVGWMKIAVVLS